MNGGTVSAGASGRGPRTLLVVNPRSAGGRTAAQWPLLSRIARRHLPDVEVALTEGPGHATELARAGLVGGVERVVAVGGDGTNNEVINGFFHDGRPVREGAIFGTVPRGTGCDFARGMRIPRDPDAAFGRLARNETAPLDVGRIDYTDAGGGGRATRYFLNVAGFGANGDVVARVNRSKKRLGGFATFLTATIASLATYRNPRVAFSLDGGPEETATVNVLFVCNAPYCGGGMMAGPKAIVDDGRFDLTLVGDMTRFEALMNGRLLYTGRIHEHPKVRNFRVQQVEARPLDGPVRVEADGEQPGILPATYSIVPGAIRRSL